MFFKKIKKIAIHSPLNAEVIPLENVPDPVFSQKMLGEGFGFVPVSGEVFSPIEGKILQVFPTKHAIGMVTSEGLEVLLHLGLETVELNGEGFDISVKEGDAIRVNDRLGTFDLSFIKEKGKDTTTVLVFTNFNEKNGEILEVNFGAVDAGAEIAKLSVK